MNKISIIINREYITRVSKKSFILMTILAPILMAALIILPTVVMLNQEMDYKKIAVIGDEADLFRGVLKNSKTLEFVYLDGVNVNDLKKTFEEAGYYGILYISSELVNTPMPFSSSRRNSLRWLICSIWRTRSRMRSRSRN